MTLRTKLLLLLSVPLAGVIFFGGRGMLEKWNLQRAYTILERDSAVLKQIGAVIHELQKERGRSAVFIGSGGAEFVRELPAQQQTTDGQITGLTGLLADFDAEGHGPEFMTKFTAGQDALARLSEQRTNILTRKITGVESSAYFTQTIAKLLDIGVAVSYSVNDKVVGNGMAAYVNYLQAKEQTGIERAVMATVFSADKFVEGTFSRFNKAAAGG